MDNLLKKETFLGNKKVILGDNKADLILQSLGKVYIKFGNNLKLLNDLFKLLDADITKDNAKSYIIIGKPDKFPGNGFFIYDNDILYITVDNEYIPLVNTKDFTEGNYVSKKGDTMTGTLTINTSKVPLIVTSKALVNNLNAELLGGYNSNSFAKVNKDETIKGNWKFEGTNEANKWNFKDTVTFEKNIVSYGDISSPEFSSGYHGYGWKLDSSTNTLTIDNLIVRKIMMVYELVINQISATNGSLWVTNSAKCKEVINISEEGELLSSNTYYLYEDGSKKYVLYTFDNFDPVEFENNLPLQPESRVKYLIDLINSGSQQNALVVDYTSDYSDITKASIIIDNNGVLETVNLYSKYFSSSNYIIVRFENETRPLFKCGDLLRCQKFQDTYIRYYDAIIITSISDSTYLLNISDLFNDNYSTMENGVISNKANTLLYSKANYNPPENPEEAKSNIGEVCEGDDLVQIGNIFDETRQGSVYITSTDNQGPYLEVLDDINRPDYSVILKTPDFYRFYKNGINYYIGVNNDYDYDDKAVLKYDSTLDEYVSADLGIIYALHKYPKSTCFIRKDSENQNKYVYKTSTKVRLGKLDGIYNPLFEDNQPKGYGLYAENVYLTGEFFLNNGQSVAEIAKDYINIGTRLDGIDSALEGMPTLGNLQEAGLYIDTVNNKVILYGDQIGILTTAPPEDQPIEFTALFSNGKIKTDYLELGNLKLSSASLPEINSSSISIDSNNLEVLNFNNEVDNIPLYNFTTAQIVNEYVNQTSNFTVSTSANLSIPVPLVPEDKISYIYFGVHFVNTDTLLQSFRVLKQNTQGSNLCKAVPYVSIRVKYNIGGNDKYIICNNSVKDVEENPEDTKLDDLEGFYTDFYISPYSKEDPPIYHPTNINSSSYIFGFVPIEGVYNYIIEVSYSYLKKFESIQPISTGTGNIGIYVGNDTINIADSDTITDIESVQNLENIELLNIEKNSNVETYISPEGLVSGTSKNDYTKISAEEFETIKRNVGFRITKSGIYYTNNRVDWKQLT